ncbi:MAG: M28 family peptidase [Bacteroidia bacterium]
MKLLAFILLFLFSTFSSIAQDTMYAKEVIAKLCSDGFQGRGYVKNGHKKAASYIKKQFKSIGLRPVENTYLQTFPIPVNTFPKTVEVRYNGKLLTAGVDYIINPSSPSIDFEGDIVFMPIIELDQETHYDKMGYTKSEAILDTFSAKDHEEAAINEKQYLSDPKKKLVIRLSNGKLTWSSSQKVDKACIITLKDEVFDRSKNANFEVHIKNKFLSKNVSQNVIGMIKGSKVSDSFIVITGHYDHLGKMGKTAIFPGANDNASGISMLLNLAKYYIKNPPKYSILFIAFSGEETGLIGSKYFVEHPLVSLADIRFLVNIDLMGNGEEGVMVVNGLVNPQEYVVFKDINDKKSYLPQVKVRGKAANSDHFWFGQAGVPAFFFYLMGEYPYYHDVFDTADAVPLYNYSEAFQLFRDFIDAMQK